MTLSLTLLFTTVRLAQSLIPRVAAAYDAILDRQRAA